MGDECRPALNHIIPASAQTPYDIKEVILQLSDKDSFFEIHEHYAENIVVGFARLAGRSVGIVANQPQGSCRCAGCQLQ